MDQQDRPLDVDYGYFDMGPGTAGAAATQRAQEYATAKVGLWPGWSVWVNLIWQNWCGAPVSGGVIIRLTFNNNTGVINIPTDVQAGGTAARIALNRGHCEVGTDTGPIDPLTKPAPTAVPLRVLLGGGEAA